MKSHVSYAIYSPDKDKYYSKIHDKAEYLWRDLDTVRLYTTIPKLTETLLALRNGTPDAIPVTINLVHDKDINGYDPIAEEAENCREEFEELTRQYDIDADAMSEKNWKRFKYLRNFYRNFDIV